MDGCVAKAWRRNVVKCFEHFGRNVKDAIEWEWESFKHLATMNLRDVDPSRARPSPSLDDASRIRRGEMGRRRNEFPVDIDIEREFYDDPAFHAAAPVRARRIDSRSKRRDPMRRID